jgi:cytochrome c
MLRLVTFICVSLVLLANSVNSQSSPPNSDQAKRIQMLVDRAAELVNSKGKEAFSEFRQRGSGWFSGTLTSLPMVPTAPWFLTRPFRHVRDMHTTEKKTKEERLFMTKL